MRSIRAWLGSLLLVSGNDNTARVLNDSGYYFTTDNTQLNIAPKSEAIISSDSPLVSTDNVPDWKSALPSPDDKQAELLVDSQILLRALQDTTGDLKITIYNKMLRIDFLGISCASFIKPLQQNGGHQQTLHIDSVD